MTVKGDRNERDEALLAAMKKAVTETTQESQQSVRVTESRLRATFPAASPQARQARVTW
jgi:hypothetical protein